MFKRTLSRKFLMVRTPSRFLLQPLLLLALVLSAASASSKNEVKPVAGQEKLKGIERAEELVAKSHAEAAREMLLPILKQEPRNAKAWYLLGRANQDLSIMGKIDSSAKDCYLKSLSIEPNYGLSYTKLGELAAIDGDYREQLRYCDRALQCKYPDIFAWKAKAIAFSNLKMDKAALDNFKKFLSQPGVNQNNPNFVGMLANFQENAGLYDDCLATLDRLEKLKNIENPMVYKLQRARCLSRAGRNQEALAVYSKLLAVKGNEVDEVLLSKRAALYTTMGKNKEALADLNHLIEAEPSMRAYKQRAAVFEKMGEHAKALSDLAKSESP